MGCITLTLDTEQFSSGGEDIKQLAEDVQAFINILHHASPDYTEAGNILQAQLDEQMEKPDTSADPVDDCISELNDNEFIKIAHKYLEDMYHRDELSPGDDLRFRYQAALVAAIECIVAAARGYKTIEDMPSEEYDRMHDPLFNFVCKEL